MWGASPTFFRYVLFFQLCINLRVAYIAFVILSPNINNCLPSSLFDGKLTFPHLSSAPFLNWKSPKRWAILVESSLENVFVLIISIKLTQPPVYFLAATVIIPFIKNITSCTDCLQNICEQQKLKILLSGSIKKCKCDEAIFIYAVAVCSWENTHSFSVIPCVCQLLGLSVSSIRCSGMLLITFVRALIGDA